MDFTSSNNIKQTVKMMNMQKTWNQKESPQQAGFLGDGKLSAIITKMQSGQQLSVADMEYLREKSPTTYDEAIKIEKEKKEYEKALRRCKTKEDARMLQLGKISEALSVLKSGAADGRVALAKLLKMTDAYLKFTGTKHYATLAVNHSQLAKAEKAQKEGKAEKAGKTEKIEKTENAEGTENATREAKAEKADQEVMNPVAEKTQMESVEKQATEPITANRFPYAVGQEIHIEKLESFRPKSKVDRHA